MTLNPTEQEANESEWTTKFAWLPTKTHNGVWVWLANYIVRKK